MKAAKYLLDTHAFFFWVVKKYAPEELIRFIDSQSSAGRIYVSTISFWEIALLRKKGRIDIKDPHAWMSGVISFSPANFIDPTAADMLDSTMLPDIHRDPFDRLLVAQAKNINARLVSKDTQLNRYKIKTVWFS